MRRAFALLLLLSLATCAPGGGLPPLPPPPPGPYRLGAGDKLRLLSVADTALDGDFRISGAGDIELPLLGRFHAAGFTASGLARALEYALKAAGLERAPSVAVEVLRYRPVYVLGEVNKPGAFPYRPGMTVLTAVAEAGGFTYRAVTGYAEVVRSGDGNTLTAKAGRDAALSPGDVVTVFERKILSDTTQSAEATLAQRRTAGVALAGIITFLNMYSIQAVLPLIAVSFAVPPAAAGLTITATTSAVAMMAPLVGSVSDMLGRKRLIVAAIWGLVVPTLMVGLAGGLAAMLAWRFVQGLLLPFVFAVTIAYIADETEGAETIRLAGTYSSGTIFAGFFGRFVAGWSAAWFGWRAAFFVLAGCTLAAAVGVGVLLPRERHFRPVRGWQATFQGFAEHLRNPRLLGTFAVGFAVLFVIVATFTYANFLLAAPPFRLGPAELGSIFVVYLAGMVATPLATRLAVRIGRRATLVGATTVGVAGLGLTLVASLAAIIAGLALFAAAAFVQGALAISYIGVAARRAKSTAVGLYVMVYYIGGSLGGLAPAGLWHAFGWPGCVGLCAGVQGVMLVAALATWREMPVPV